MMHSSTICENTTDNILDANEGRLKLKLSINLGGSSGKQHPIIGSTDHYALFDTLHQTFQSLLKFCAVLGS